MPNLNNFLGAGSIVTGFLFSGVIILFSDFLSKKLTKGRLHPSAIAIFFGLILAYVGGVITGGEKGMADVAAFGGLGILGGSALRDFTIIASSYGASVEEVKKCGWACPISLLVGVTSAFFMGTVVMLSEYLRMRWKKQSNTTLLIG